MAPFGDRTSCEELGTLIGIIPDWCCSSWCFVDVKNCKRPHSSLYSHSFHEYTDFALVDSTEEEKNTIRVTRLVEILMFILQIKSTRLSVLMI